MFSLERLKKKNWGLTLSKKNYVGKNFGNKNLLAPKFVIQGQFYFLWEELIYVRN